MTIEIVTHEHHGQLVLTEYRLNALRLVQYLEGDIYVERLDPHGDNRIILDAAEAADLRALLERAAE